MAGAGHFYPIGKAGCAWGAEEREQWLTAVDKPQRSYAADVLERLPSFEGAFELHQ